MSENMRPLATGFGHHRLVGTLATPDGEPETREEQRPSGVVPREVGPYRLEGTLGRGGFGTVYRALDMRSGQSVALKVLHRHVAGDAELLSRFLREARTTSAADNPHVVRVIDAHEDLEGFACIAFELLSGETLDARLRREGSLSPNEAVDFAVQILDGLEVAHERGIVHRDVKPANLFLVDDGLPTKCVKILDFGIGRLGGAEGNKLTATGTSLGTPFYMAPEQVFDSSRADARADLYGVAVCLYRMLSAGMPHGDGAAAAWLSFVAEGQVAARVTSPYGDLPEPLVEAVALGLSPLPEARWQNAAAFSNALLDSLPGASAPTRISYEPAAVLRAPIRAPAGYRASTPAPPAPREVQPHAAQSGRHAAMSFEAVSADAILASVPQSRPARAGPAATLPAAPEPSWVAKPIASAAPTKQRRVLLIALVVAIALLLLTLTALGIAAAFVLGQMSGERAQTEASSPR